MKADYIIIGSGITGAVIARVLKDAGKEVAIVERRSYLGGELHETTHQSGIRIHSHGPQYFQTSNERVWRFANRFAWFYQFEERVKFQIDNSYEQWPLSSSYLERRGYQSSQQTHDVSKTLADAYQKEFSPSLYMSLLEEYLEKQWGVSPSTLPSFLADGIEAREGEDDRFSNHLWQGLPSGGYKTFVENLLDGIPVILSANYLHSRDAFEAGKLLIYTGHLDEYYDYQFGSLEYRGHQRTHTYVPNASLVLPSVQVENPRYASGSHIRTIEWKHMMAPDERKTIHGSVLTQEVAFLAEQSEDRELPLCDDKNLSLFARYKELSLATPKVLMCGPYGDYRYQTLDQSITKALEISDRILGVGALSDTLSSLFSATKDIKRLGDDAQDSPSAPIASETLPLPE